MMRALVALLFTSFLTLAGGTAAAQSVTLSPAVVPLGGLPGQSTSQRLTLFNSTDQTLSFDVVAKDVVVRNGARTFVPAGDLPSSIAATAVLSSRKITVGPGEERSIQVTLTLPAQLPCRAVIVLFQGTTRIGGNATVSIGSLLTFDLAGRVSLAPAELRVDPPTASSNAALTLPITNDGNEPAVVRGAAVIVSASGALTGKVRFDTRRLLPLEKTALHADYPGELPSGHYRVIATIETDKQSWTRTAELDIP